MLRDLGDLEMFTKVVATSSMSEAARLLDVSPAVVSKAIKRLETALGVRLFQRTTRQIVVTEVGLAFYDRVCKGIDAIREAEEFVAGRSTELTGAIRISAPTSFGRMHVAPHLHRFMEQHPQISIELSLSDTLTDVIAEGFDMAIRISALKDSGLIARRLAPIKRLLCASQDYIERFAAPGIIDDLAHHHCLPTHNNEPWRLEGPDGALVYRPRGSLRTNSSEVVREAVLSGLGIALRSTWDIGQELSDGRLVRVLPDYQGAHDVAIFAVFPSRQFVPAKVRAFIEFLQSTYGPLPYWDRSEIISSTE